MYFLLVEKIWFCNKTHMILPQAANYVNIGRPFYNKTRNLLLTKMVNNVDND